MSTVIGFEEFHRQLLFQRPQKLRLEQVDFELCYHFHHLRHHHQYPYLLLSHSVHLAKLPNFIDQQGN